MDKRLRDAARMRACTVRLPCCARDPAQTVAAHLPSTESGVGYKSPDWWIVFACQPCHDALDWRTSPYDTDMMLERMLQGHFETMSFLFDSGLVRLK